MVNNRQHQGDDTYQRLTNWTNDQKTSERLCAHILRIDGFESVDPSHPLGGPDGGKDIVVEKNGRKSVCACYFPRNQIGFRQVKQKFESDLAKAKASGIGFIFLTNQKISNTQRKTLTDIDLNTPTDIFHLERINSLLNSPICYGIRLEYLGIELTREEQVSYFTARDKSFEQIAQDLRSIYSLLQSIKEASPTDSSKIFEFEEVLERIVGSPGNIVLGISPIDRLRIPIKELHEFNAVLRKIIGGDYPIGSEPIARLRIPLDDLKEFNKIITTLVGEPEVFSPSLPKIDRLSVPLEGLKEYETTLDRILEKQAKLGLVSLNPGSGPVLHET